MSAKKKGTNQESVSTQLDAYERLANLHAPTPYETSLKALWMATIQNGVAVESMAKALVEQAKQERKELRQQITERHKATHGRLSRIQCSRVVLSRIARLEGLELVWSELWYLPGDKKPKFNRIPCTGAKGTDLRKVIKNAHADEVALLTKHEGEARHIRSLWRAQVEFRRWVRAAINHALKKREQEPGY